MVRIVLGLLLLVSLAGCAKKPVKTSAPVPPAPIPAPVPVRRRPLKTGDIVLVNCEPSGRHRCDCRDPHTTISTTGGASYQVIECKSSKK